VLLGEREGREREGGRETATRGRGGRERNREGRGRGGQREPESTKRAGNR